MNDRLNRAWAEVNLDNIAHNVREIRKITGSRAKIMGIVKADGYGHGVMEVAKTILDNGVSYLAVSMLDEAIQLRNNGIGVPILILSYTDPKRAEEIIQNDVTQAVFSHDLAEALSAAAVKLGRSVRIHIKLDTGMTRVGFMPGYSAIKNVLQISRLPGIIVEGLFTHFASADEPDKTYTKMQFEKFMSICNELGRVGLHIPVKHAANSAAIIGFPETHLDLVRPGLIMYGMYPSDDVDRTRLSLKPAMTLKANVTMVKDVEAGTSISYGRVFTTSAPSVVATLPIGYADGYTRLLTGKGRVLIHGEYAPVVGRICMDQCMVDVTGLKNNVSVGDEAVLFGSQDGLEIPVEEVAAKIGTINYEVITLIGRRIPRVYIQNGSISSVLNYLI